VGHHYVPQYYLRGFCRDGNHLWVFDKQDQHAFTTHVKNVASETAFYSEEVENLLAQSVEQPANQVLAAIRARKPVSPTEKRSLAAYINCLWKRVPQGKRRLRDSASSISQQLASEYDSQFEEAVREHPEDREHFEKIRARIQELLDRWSADPPEEAWLRNLAPGATPKSVAVLSQMTWRFLVFDSRPAFLTSDNPVFFFPHLGIGRPQSELTFPVSSNIVLWATWRSDLEEGYHPATENVVGKVNRRTASITTRFAFHADYEDWVLPLLNKPKRRLEPL